MSSRQSVPRIVIAPDSFKGSLSAAAAARAMADGIRRVRPDAHLILTPMADGGEGTLEAMLTRGGQALTLQVDGASGARRVANAGLLADGSGMLECAEIVGITDTVAMAVPVTERSSTGLGMAIRALLDRGIGRILIGLGGSSTNDGGAGMLAALGAALLDVEGRAVAPTPAGLARLHRVDLRQLDARLRDTQLIALNDVDNPLIGDTGATAVFGLQKGVSPAEVKSIDASLNRYAALLEAAGGWPTRSSEESAKARDLPGAGAAGGLGFALWLLGAELAAGAEVVATEIRLDAALAGAHWLITGEGRSDTQTLNGKAPFVACRHAQRVGVPATLLSGAVDTLALPRLAACFDGCFSSAPGPIGLELALRDAAALLADAAQQLARLRFLG
ncbi:MAG: glycerate kinase [Janthinobacterium lividum]